jgi:hypothetical protein
MPDINPYVTILLLLILISALFVIRYRNAPIPERNQKDQDSTTCAEDNESSYIPTEEERIFVNRAMEDYAYNIIICFSKDGKPVIMQHMCQPTVSKAEEVFLRIHLLIDRSKQLELITDCYFSGRVEFCYDDKRKTIEKFDISLITKVLQEFELV